MDTFLDRLKGWIILVKLTNGYMDGWMNKWTNGCLDEWMNEWLPVTSGTWSLDWSSTGNTTNSSATLLQSSIGLIDLLIDWWTDWFNKSIISNINLPSILQKKVYLSLCILKRPLSIFYDLSQRFYYLDQVDWLID